MHAYDTVIVAGFKLNAAFCMARVRGIGGAFIRQADLSAIAWHTTDIDNPSIEVATGALVISACINDMLVTRSADPRWPADAPWSGYNLGATIPGSAFPKGDTRYAVRVDLTPTAGDPLTVYFENHTHPDFPHS